MAARVALRACESRVLLSGGCFQNKLLLERVCSLLESNGLEPFYHTRLPANDGGIAPGQVLAALDGMKNT
jgi:hydrogenase maturation protein HypF